MIATRDNKEPKWQLALLLVLFISVIVVAIMTVMLRHQSRGLFVQSQKLTKDYNILIAQWSRLKLEQGVVLNEIYVERKARENLGMRIPKTKNIKVVEE